MVLRRNRQDCGAIYAPERYQAGTALPIETGDHDALAAFDGVAGQLRRDLCFPAPFPETMRQTRIFAAKAA